MYDQILCGVQKYSRLSNLWSWHHLKGVKLRWEEWGRCTMGVGWQFPSVVKGCMKKQREKKKEAAETYAVTQHHWVLKKVTAIWQNSISVFLCMLCAKEEASLGCFYCFLSSKVFFERSGSYQTMVTEVDCFAVARCSSMLSNLKIFNQYSVYLHATCPALLPPIGSFPKLGKESRELFSWGNSFVNHF